MLSPERLQKLSSDFKDKDEDQKPLEGEQDSSRSKPQLELHPDSLLSEYYWRLRRFIELSMENTKALVKQLAPIYFELDLLDSNGKE